MRRCALLAFTAVLLFTGATTDDGTGGGDGVELVAAIGGQDVSRADSNRPATLHPETATEVHLVVTNHGADPVTVRSVRIDGGVAGLAFFNFETVIGMEVAPGTTEERTYQLDLVGLAGQATGLIPAELQLLDQDRDVLASVGFVADVRGSLRSVYGLFGLAVAAFTALTLTAACLALARHQLAANRFRRGLQFMVPGLGLGLTLTFTLSALRVFAPSAALWLPLTLLFGAAGFAVGYMAPGPDDADETDEIGEIGDADATDDDAGGSDEADTATLGAPGGSPADPARSPTLG